MNIYSSSRPLRCMFVSLLQQILRNLALHHLLTNGSSAVNGYRQNESPNSVFFFAQKQQIKVKTP